MKQKCKFCKERDKREVAPSLGIDLAKSMETKVIQGTGTEDHSNGIELPSDVYGRVRDQFEAIDAQRAIMARGKAEAAQAAAAKAAETTTTTTSTADSGAAN